MSLGILNDISALYAENNLNQTQSSLQNTLTQLSSGSRINSGSDDAAGLSLANGLEASSTALTQSASNASEGVDFLSVADGALSQVTNLLNRAVTLATEASNGTLNSSQEDATQAEYSSILTEISTINQNTESNGINVFNQAANIFTSDGTVSQTYATSALGSTSSDSLKLGSAVYTSGMVAAADATLVGKTDSYGNAITKGDNILTSTNASGNAVTVDLTAMGDKTTGVGALSNANAVSISGDKAVAGSVALATANTAAGADQYGTTVAAGDYVFTASSEGTTVYNTGNVTAATAKGTDSNGNAIAVGDNVLATTNAAGDAITLNLTAMGDTTTTGSLSNTNAVAVTANKAVAGQVALTSSAPATGSTDTYDTTVAAGDFVFTTASTAVYTSGAVKAAMGAGTDSNGNAITTGDNVLTTVDSNGNAVTLDLTAMGDTTTAVGSLSASNAVAVTGNAATAGLVEKSTTAGTDGYGNAVTAGSFVFTTTAGTDTGTGTFNLGTTAPGGSSIYTSGTVTAATDSQIGSKDANGNVIATGDNILATMDANGKALTLDLTAMGDTTTTTGALSNANAVAVSGNKAEAGFVDQAAAGGTDGFGNTVTAGDFVFTTAAGTTTGTGTFDLGTFATAQIYASGTIAAATAGQVTTGTDALGNSIASTTDSILTTTNSTGGTVILDLTAMGMSAAQVTALGATLAAGKAVAVTGSAGDYTATGGAVTAATAASTDTLGNKVATGDNVFTSTAGTATYDVGTATPTNEVVVSALPKVESANAVLVGNAPTAPVVVGTTTGTGTYDLGATAPAANTFAGPMSGAGTVQLGTANPNTLANATFAGTSLDSASQAETALTAITDAISQVAAARGTEGAEVNTLTAVENVQTTESTNTTSAENDVLATDYAATTSNLSKYEILEQTGISALSQANSTEQLVTKLLQ